ncbi:hypothetical protein R5W60_16575 [Brucella pseudintermedia]|uniref:hypothetical protein n=1 Tax=Brucella pseudintermedia TaxID=370111 RepID=UPI00366ADA5F|nr:hypothetical protein R5W60_16575 [Brucella pseudintermedia]
MPSKELIALVAKAIIENPPIETMTDDEIIIDWSPTAKAAVDVVLEASADVARKWWHNPTCERPDMAILATLAASALGEQSE